jgi:hypothetical protein
VTGREAQEAEPVGSKSGTGDGGAAPAAVILRSVATPELNNRHRDTLEKIFRHPASANLDWHHVVSLLDAVGTVEEDGANVKVTLGGETQMLRRPKGKDIDTQMVVDLRRLLTEAGVEPPAGGA